MARVQGNLLNRKDCKMFDSPVLSAFARVIRSLKDTSKTSAANESCSHTKAKIASCLSEGEHFTGT